MDSDGEEDGQDFAKQGGDALDLEDDDDGAFNQNDSEDADPDDEDADPDDEDDMVDPTKKGSGSKAFGAGVGQAKEVKGEKLENQPYDLAVDVNDSEEIESDEEDDEVNMNDVQRNPQNQAAPSMAHQQKQSQQPQKMPQRDPEEEDGEDDKEVPGTYNPAEFANLQVSQDVKDLFEYIQRYKPQKIDLETQLKPFIPDYVPAVGEVDACLKMPKPDGAKEDLGITQLDEPALNCEDKTVLELKYVQSKNVVRAAPVSVDGIENADKKPKEISRWISSVQDLHKTRPPATVNYTKQMPDFDEHLMIEMVPELEQALNQFTFPGGEIDISSDDYARIVLTMLDIPVHKLANKKSLIESLHVLFTLFSTFRSNQHFQPKGAEGAGGPDSKFFENNN